MYKISTRISYIIHMYKYVLVYVYYIHVYAYASMYIVNFFSIHIHIIHYIFITYSLCACTCTKHHGKNVDCSFWNVKNSKLCFKTKKKSIFFFEIGHFWSTFQQQQSIISETSWDKHRFLLLKCWSDIIDDCCWNVDQILQPFAFGVSLNHNLSSQSPWSLFDVSFRRNVAKET